MKFIDNDFLAIFALISIPFLALFLIRVVRFLYNLIRYLYLSRKYKVKYDKDTQRILKGYTGKPEEIIEKNREEELKLLEETRKLNKSYGLMEVDEQKTIVGIAKPKGIWTEFVTKQKMSWLRAMIGTKAESDSFWRNMINAQSQSQSREQSRQR